jgi:bile acid:Na+ symporter, BASS family
MFGIALDVRSPTSARCSPPAAPLIGLLAQFLLLPAATFALTRDLDPAPSIALGMILVGCCPGGNISNIITHLAKRQHRPVDRDDRRVDAAAAVMTPLNFAFWGSLTPTPARCCARSRSTRSSWRSPSACCSAVPVAAGVTLRRPARAGDKALPADAHRLDRSSSSLFVAVAFVNNAEHFTRVLLGGVAARRVAAQRHRAGAGYGAAAAARLPERDRRAVAIEVGIQNSALALVLIFGFFDGLGGMALVAAWWGIWHIIAGWPSPACGRGPPRRPTTPGTAVSGT